MGILSTIKKTYYNVDKKVGGILPAGYTKSSTTTAKTTTNQQTPTSFQKSTPVTSGSVGYYYNLDSGAVYTKPETSKGSFTPVTTPITYTSKPDSRGNVNVTTVNMPNVIDEKGAVIGTGSQLILPPEAQIKNVTPERVGSLKPSKPSFSSAITTTNLKTDAYRNYVQDASYSTLYKRGDIPALVTKPFFSAGNVLFKGVSTAWTKGTGQSPLSSYRIKQGGSFVGELGLYTFFLNPFATSGQMASQFSKPAQVKVLGTSQQISSKGAETNIIYRATKGSNTQFGYAKGFNTVSKIGKNLYEVKGVGVGATFKRGVSLGGRFKQVPQEAYIVLQKGVGTQRGKLFGVVSNFKAFTNKEIIKGSSGIISTTGSKGISLYQGGAVSSKGVAKISGIDFRVPTQPLKFIPLASKGGQVLISPFKTGSSAVIRAGSKGVSLGAKASFNFVNSLALTSSSKMSPLILTSKSGIGVGSTSLATSLRRPSPTTTTRDLAPNFMAIPRREIDRVQPTVIPTPRLTTTTGSKSKGKGGSSLIGGLVLSTPSASSTRPSIINIPSITQGTTQSQRTRLRLITPQTQRGSSTSYGIFNFNTPSTTTPKIPLFALSPSSSSVFASVKGGGKVRTGYTPSYSALIFNIKGSYKGGKLKRSGIDFRPIKRSFKFKTGLA